MSESHSTTPQAAGKPIKPAKPFRDFPLFPHASGQWAKKIRGKARYFGKWEDWRGALARYEKERAALEENPKTTPDYTRLPQPATTAARPAKAAKPGKPYEDFPLTAHPCGQWCKKVRGKIHYFGPWGDPDGALQSYLAQKDALHAGCKPRPDGDGATVKGVVNAFLNHKDAILAAGELSPHTRTKYQEAGELVIAQLGKSRLAVDLDPEDFATLRGRMAKKWGLHRLADMIQHVRSIFKHGYDAGLIPVPTRFGPGFARPTKKAIRLHKARQGAKLFSADEIRRMLDAATLSLRAMLLLGINAGMGNSDCANLPVTALDLETGWIDYPRPKTGVARRCPLWPETVAALKAVMAKRPVPRSEKDAVLVFVTKYGDAWAKEAEGGPITKETRKLLDKLGIDGHRNFYTLRHAFRTIADASKDQPAVDHIMGHESGHMSSVYRETIADERLRAVADHVRRWLFPSTVFATAAGEQP